MKKHPGLPVLYGFAGVRNDITNFSASFRALIGPRRFSRRGRAWLTVERPIALN